MSIAERFSLGDVLNAARRISGIVRETPLESSAWLTEVADTPVSLKLECWQRTRSFKLRGAANAVASMNADTLRSGPVTASAGNHGQAVALSAREAGGRATVFVPASAPAVKLDRIRRLGADLRVAGSDYDQAEALAREFADLHGRPFVHAFSDARVVAGQGTVALEILRQAPDVRTVIVPVGGGGLISGIGMVMRELAPHVRVIGVQSEETRAMYDAFAAGRVVPVPVPPTLADGLAGCTDQATYELARDVVHRMLVVSERTIADAIRGLYHHEGVVAEGSGAVGAAALLERAVHSDGRVVIVVSGGNIDSGVLSALLADT